MTNSDNGLAPNRRLAIILANDGLVYLCIYASVGHNELISHGKAVLSNVSLESCVYSAIVIDVLHVILYYKGLGLCSMSIDLTY